MEINKHQLDEAAEHGLLTATQSEALWAFWQQRATAPMTTPATTATPADTPRFKAAHILYYLGGMIAIGAMSLFLTVGWGRFGSAGLLLISALYACAALALTDFLLYHKQLPLPAGITAALAVVMVPLMVYAAQHLLGLWPGDIADADGYHDYHVRVDWRWLLMELATLAAAALAVWRYRLPFLLMPVAVTLWYMSMDLVPFLLGEGSAQFYSMQGRRISTGFGLAMLLLAFWVDLRNRDRRDFAFWLYLFGVLTFWGGLTSLDSGSQLGKFIYACINLLLIAVGAALSRRVFAVFGGLGLALYLGYLSYKVFRDSLMFSLALSVIGLGIMGAGIYWQRHEAAIGARLRSVLPLALRELIARRSV